MLMIHNCLWPAGVLATGLKDLLSVFKPMQSDSRYIVNVYRHAGNCVTVEHTRHWVIFDAVNMRHSDWPNVSVTDWWAI